MIAIRQMLVDPSKYGIKCPYGMNAQYITIHNTANDASANNEISYMINNNNEVSYHIAVDDVEAVQGIPFDRNAWHAGDGNGAGNRQSIGIEICYSASGGDRYTKAEENAVQLTAQLLKERGWGIDRLRKHQDWSGKFCPHRILAEGRWESFKQRVQQAMGGTPTPTPTPSDHISVTYQIWDDVKNCWLPNVVDLSDYAGLNGHDVCCVYANLSKGNITYKVHYKGGKWLPQVTNRSDYAGIFNKPIDGLMMTTDTGRIIHYRVRLRRTGRWLPYVTGYNENDHNNGYAGVIGQEIDGIQIYLD